ncbi:winged helix-turn-helix domain-containing protein [Bacillus sp. AFS040349]|uniref:winged helix-turn-helix domain-containing protein n=1 Tax=Bacillus sp. AFS040349 TaxID=2033502 RepID=UPI001145B278|nr:winged helix-turn-helix domain-containing protein [Bacillus sp. AFS040349]
MRCLKKVKMVNSWIKLKTFRKNYSNQIGYKDFEQKYIKSSLITLDDLELKEEIIITVLDLRIDYKQRRIYINNKSFELTPKEFDLLMLLALNQEIIFTREMLTDQIFSIHEILDISIVDDQVRTLCKKLQSYHISLIQ